MVNGNAKSLQVSLNLLIRKQCKMLINILNLNQKKKSGIGGQSHWVRRHQRAVNPHLYIGPSSSAAPPIYTYLRYSSYRSPHSLLLIRRLRFQVKFWKGFRPTTAPCSTRPSLQGVPSLPGAPGTHHRQWRHETPMKTSQGSRPETPCHLHRL